MCKIWVSTFAALLAVGSLGAQSYQRNATITGNGSPNGGKCTIEVVVDSSAEVQISGSSATLRNLAGQPPQWRRFECTSPMPASAANFRFQGIDGRGRQQLVRDPRNGGAAVVRIDDPDGGSEGYTFDIMWGGGFNEPGNRPGPGDRPGPIGRPPIGGGRFTTEQAINVCRDEVRRQAGDRYGTDIEFRDMRLDDRPGRNDWIVGTFAVRRGRGQSHSFACSVNFDNGRVRSVDIDQDIRGGGGSADRTRDAVRNCQREVESRLHTRGYGDISVSNIRVDDRPGRNDWVVGNLRAAHGFGFEAYEFSCRVNLNDGDVRSVDMNRR